MTSKVAHHTTSFASHHAAFATASAASFTSMVVASVAATVAAARRRLGADCSVLATLSSKLSRKLLACFFQIKVRRCKAKAQTEKGQ
jgi:hypothetical protein